MVRCFFPIRIPKYFHFEGGVTMHKIASLFVFGCLLTLLGQVNAANGETVGERFDKADGKDGGDAANDASYRNSFERSAA